MEENMIDVNETEKYLPIGTVVLLKGATKRLMIAGYCAVDQEKKDEMWDYSGCMYPEGFLSSQQSFLFDHSQIAKIYSLGFKDNEEEEFQQKLVNYMNTKGSGEDGTDDSDDSSDSTPVSGEGNSAAESSESLAEEEKIDTNQLLDESSNVDTTSFDTSINNSVGESSTPVAEEPATTEPVAQPVSNPTVSDAGNVAPTSDANASAPNPNNAGDLSEFDQWLNQTGPYSNDGNGTNTTNQ